LELLFTFFSVKYFFYVHRNENLLQPLEPTETDAGPGRKRDEG